MPIRLGKGMLKVLKHFAKNQQRGVRVNFLIDPLTPRERKAIRQLIKENEREHSDKVPVAAVKHARRNPNELTKSWANHFSNHRYSLEAVAELAEVPVLTSEQEAFHSGITPEASSLKNAVKLYAKPENR